jgi:exodeoxyribonuclease VIII
MTSDFIKSASLRECQRGTEEWKSCKDYISKSGLVRIKESPDHYRNGEPYVETPEKVFGKQYHCYVLEPDEFEKRYYVFDDSIVYGALIAKGVEKPRATKDYKIWLAGEEKLMDNKEIIDKKDFDRMKGMKEKLFSHFYAKMLLTNGVAERGILGELETEVGKIGIKLITDYRKDIKHLIMELKTTKDASEKGFARECGEYDYHIQAAFYTDMLELFFNDQRPITFVFIAQEKRKPYAFNLFECSPQFISQGRYEYEMLLQLYKYCIDNNIWPGYQVFCENKYGILELKLPAWAIKDLTYYDHINHKISTQKELTT